MKSWESLVLLTREPHEFASEEIEILDRASQPSGDGHSQVQLYAQIKSQADELERANREICDFTAMIAHDLRSPLNQVMGVSELMTDSVFGPVTDDQKKWLGKSRRNCAPIGQPGERFPRRVKARGRSHRSQLERSRLKSSSMPCFDNYQIVAKDREILLRKKVGATPQPISRRSASPGTSPRNLG